MQRVYTSTNGCEEGQLKSMKVKNFFQANNFSITEDMTSADYIIYFACGLTDQKEKLSFNTIKKLQEKKKKNAKLIVWGCLPKINPKELKKIYSGPTVGPKDLDFFDNILKERTVSIQEVSANALDIIEPIANQQVEPTIRINVFNSIMWRLKNGADLLRLPRRKSLFDEASFFIRVAEGCQGHCSYCSEKPAWGNVKSRPIEKIISEFTIGLEKGYKRFFLVAADLGSYGVDIGSNAIDLLQEILKAGGNREFNLILNQINPADLKRLLPGLEPIFASGKIEAIGCQVESGSNRIIELMGRNYEPTSWRDCMVRIHEKFPFIRLSTHVLIGFPSETEDDFEATMKLLNFPLFIDWVGFFIFSPRPTVYASRLEGQVPYLTKYDRQQKLIQKYLLMYLLNVVVTNVKYIKIKMRKRKNI